MKFIIHHMNNITNEENDSIVIEGNTVKELQQKGQDILKCRNWDENDCWSEELKS